MEVWTPDAGTGETEAVAPRADVFGWLLVQPAAVAPTNAATTTVLAADRATEVTVTVI